MDGGIQDRLRGLPSVDRVASALDVPPSLATAAARRAIDTARADVRAGRPTPSFEDLVATARALLARENERRLQPVINATGVLLHTNLGRAPLGKTQLNAVARVAGSYSNLEYELSIGRRGDRYSHAARGLTTLTGAEAALVVNNNAAAVLLVLAALARGREVVISRGELIEIGGEFRIPDVLGASGARLVEIGTTNRTHRDDYMRALTPETAAILKVHPSNYRVVGFTASVPARDIAAIAREHGVLFIHDLGSGLIEAPAGSDWVREEPPASLAVADGADIVTFSGDKLLGGPQAGIIVGRKDLIERIARHPLLRALRVDKMTLAALEATLDAYIEGAPERLPLWQMASSEDVEDRARAAVATLESRVSRNVKLEAVAVAGLSGGGSLPGAEIGSWAISVTHPEMTAAEIQRRLRAADPPVIARVEAERLLLDLRTVFPEQEPHLVAAIVGALDEESVE